MALTVQNDSGTVTGANAYVTVAVFKAYHDARGNSYGAAADADIEKAIIKATDYLDQRFSFRGVRSHVASSQPTAWPRLNVVDGDGNYVSGIPEALKRACSEYALRALTAELNPDPVKTDDSGLAVRSVSKTVGPITKNIVYSGVNLVQQLPSYPAADRLLAAAGLLDSSNQLARA